jgi:hypothetical protein
MIRCGDSHFHESKCLSMALVLCFTLLLDNTRWMLRKVFVRGWSGGLEDRELQHAHTHCAQFPSLDIARQTQRT